MKSLDVRGLNCPEPVIQVKKAIESGNSEIEVITDARVAVENITRLCNKLCYSISVSEKGGDFLLSIKKK